jgi:phosphohistidine phosphatase SixA
MTVFLVRHADAKSRAAWHDVDENRPLSKKGHDQAQALVELLVERGVGRILSSPAVRCVDTVEPLADKLGVQVEKTDVLLEGSDGGTAYALMCELARRPDSSVLCTHGDLVPELLRLAARDGLVLDDTPRWPKGSMFAIETDGGTFTLARYHPPPEG